MTEATDRTESLDDSLAAGVAAVMAASDEIYPPEDMADLFLEELNRLWTEPFAEPGENPVPAAA